MATATRTHYSVREIYRITLLALRTTRAARHARCDRAASERVMLAVTEVNGCEICSYAHTRRALEAGLSDAEVRELLGGVSRGSGWATGRDRVRPALRRHPRTPAACGVD